MERRQHEETAEGSRSHQSTLTGTLALKNFTIPRKKRTSGEGFSKIQIDRILFVMTYTLLKILNHQQSPVHQQNVLSNIFSKYVLHGGSR